MAIRAQFWHIRFSAGFWYPVLLGHFFTHIFGYRIYGPGIRNHQFCGVENRPYYSLLAGRSPFRWAGEGGKREKGLF
jgi:hypothetical protein